MFLNWFFKRLKKNPMCYVKLQNNKVTKTTKKLTTKQVLKITGKCFFFIRKSAYSFVKRIGKLKLCKKYKK